MDSDRSTDGLPSPDAGSSAPTTYWAVAEPPALPPPAGTRYAPVSVRFVAWLVDLLPLLVLGAILFGPILIGFFETMIRALPDRIRPGQVYFPELQAAMGNAFANALPGFLRASALLQVGSLAYLLGSWLAFGRSPGMALLAIRIAREEDGGRPGAGRLIVRYSGYIVSAIPFLFGYAWAIFDARNQAWHDKLAGTVVVHGQAPAAADAAPIRRRPSIGAVADRAWAILWRAPQDLLASIGVVLVPGLIVLIPILAVYFVVQQDQSIAGVGSVRELFSRIGDPIAYRQYNLRMIATTAPIVWIGALSGFVGSIVGVSLIGVTAAAVDDAGRIVSPDEVTRAVRDRLGTLLSLGLAAGAFSGLSVLAFGLPELAIADVQTVDPGRYAFLGAVAALALLITVPISLYFGTIWLLAVVCAVRERLGVTDSFRRAWRLSRHRMRWLVGTSVMASLGIAFVVTPIGLLPLGLLSESYLQGQRLPISLTVVLVGLIALVSAPLVSLMFVEMYRAAREEAEGGSELAQSGVA